MEQLLKQFGLTEPEIVVYKRLLKKGGSKVSEIAQNTGIKRTSCQEYVKNLEEDGFVISSVIGKKIYYQVEDPDKFRQIINERQFVVDNLINRLKQEKRTEEWSVRSVSVEESSQQIGRAKRKGKQIANFGNKIAGGKIFEDFLLLFNEDKELPAIEIKSKSIVELHRHLLKQKF